MIFSINYCIDQDFFAKDGKNIALKEIFFDAKFPTLFDNSLPHVITIIDGKDHNISEFPSKYKEIDSFVKLFSTKKGSRVVAPMKIYQNFYVDKTPPRIAYTNDDILA